MDRNPLQTSGSGRSALAAAERELHVVLGSGPAGTTLAAELAGRRHPVRLVSWRVDGPATAGVERRGADATGSADVSASIAGAAVVYHCVSVPYHLQVDVMAHIQEGILDAVAAAGARLVVLDTLYPYGEAHGAVMTEDTRWRATTQTGQLLAELDERYLEAHRAGRARVVLGRSADFFGPGVLHSRPGGVIFPGALTGGEVVGVRDLDMPHSYTYIADVAAGLATLGEHPETDGRVWHLPTAPATTTRHLFSLIEERIGGPRPFGPFDEQFMDGYAEMFVQHPEPQVVDSSAFERAFDVHPTPLEESLDATVAWYRDWLWRSR